MRKIKISFIFAFFGAAFLLNAETKKLPDIDSLKVLPVSLVMDTTENEEIACPALPVISKDDVIVFFDNKLKQLFLTRLKNPKMLPISRSGEGPKEYASSVNSIIIDNELFYMIDYKGKILCFSLKGEFKWEVATRKNVTQIIGKRGDNFYLTESAFTEKLDVNLSLLEWEKGRGFRQIYALPTLTAHMDAIIDGKIQKGCGVYTYAYPAYTICGDTIWAAADEKYRFKIFDLNGKVKKTVSIEAPKPEVASHESMVKDNYAIMDIFCDPPYIYIVSNYFKDGKPRVDLFTPDGKLVKSFLFPYKANSSNAFSGRPSTQTASISGPYFIYVDGDESGFKIYRITPGL
jgi:hypothetical protein